MKSSAVESGVIDRNLAPENVILDYNVEFNVSGGTGSLCCFWGLVSYGIGFTCCCIAHKFMTSQEVQFGDKTLNYKSDCWLLKVDKMVPYDRIQDVNITENCIQRCWGVSDVSIQTAGGGERPEVVITAPTDPKRLRDVIMAHRDGIVHNQPSGHKDDGTGTSSFSPLLGDDNRNVTGNDSKGKQQELVGIHQSLLRIEKLMGEGIDKLNGNAAV